MNDNKRYSLLILVFFAIAAIFTVIWGLFLNYGKITVNGQAPFEVNVISGPTIKCQQSPCEIELKPGPHAVIFQKSGFREIRENIDVQRWGNGDVKIDFQFIPVIEPVENAAELSTDQTADIPKEAVASYLMPNNNNIFYLAVAADGREALMFKGDGESKVIAYFPKSLENPTILASENGKKVAVLEKADQLNSVYLIDADASNRQKIFQSTTAIEHFVIAPDGSKIALISGQKAYLVNTDGSSEELTFAVEGKGLAWFNDKTLVVISPTLLTSDLQAAAENVLQNDNVAFDDYMKILDAANESTEVTTDEKTLFFYFYNIENKSLERLVGVTGTKNLPVQLAVESTSDGQKLFFYDEENKKYQIVFQP